MSQLNPEILVKIQHCFQDLQPQVKLKLLLSFFHIPRRNLEQWRRELETILSIATEDSEPWVCMLAELMKTFPETGQLCTDISVPDSNRKIFNDLLSDLKKALKKSSAATSSSSGAATDKDYMVLPLECHYLNKNAFISVVGHHPQASKHFTLRRKPKAAALKAELLNKSQEAANKLKTNPAGYPMRKSTMPRKMSDTRPLQGLPSRTLGSSGFRNPRVPMPSRGSGLKKEGGVKLLDINEQPIGQAAMKKRKRQQEIEDAKKHAEESKNDTPTTAGGVASAKTAPATATPDYAAGLSTLNPPTPAPPPAYAPPTPTALQAPPTPAYAPPTPSLQTNTPVTTILPTAVVTPQLPNMPLPQTVATPMLPTTPIPVSQTKAGSNPNTFLQQLQPLPPSALQTSATSIVARLPTQPQPRASLGQGAARIVQLPTQPIPPNKVAQMQTRPPGGPAPVTLINAANLPQGARIVRAVAPGQATIRQVGPPANLQAPPPPVPQRRSLTLTKDQMLEAQEMFRTANKVTRPEKALILGFMAGSRDNPCPHLGSVVTIKLSENQENVLQNDGTYLTMIVETHFQMNYSTGEWKRIKKYRRLEDP